MALVADDTCRISMRFLFLTKYRLMFIVFMKGVFSKQAFFSAFTVILSHGVYLPAAKCFALLPIVSGMRRSGHENAMMVDYDDASGSVCLTARKAYT